MKISNNANIHHILKTYQKNNDLATNPVQRPGQKKDQIEISEKAQEFRIALDAYQKLPEVRKDKIEELTRQIRSGNYNPSAEEIVDSLFDKKI